MASLRIENLSKSYGHFKAVDNVSFELGNGEFLVLLGPSGCGKTTTLRMIAGFVEPSDGVVFLGDTDITNLPPWKRNAGLVFQSYALFPHLTVGQNVAFGLEMRRVRPSEIRSRVREALELVRLDHLSDRLPRQLSGGQQQRVALARALAFQPDVLLLDEPLSNLDAKLREVVRLEIRKLQQSLNLTTVMVTHDQEEALTMADRLVVMSEGAVCQIGTQRDLYERPANRFVAGFVGRSSFLAGTIEANQRFRSKGGVQVLSGPSEHRGPATLAIRPERITVAREPLQLDNSLTGIVEHISYLGNASDVHVRLAPDETVVVQIPNQDGRFIPASGEKVHLGWAASAASVFPEEQQLKA